ncbi:MAG: hypothetical protein L0338_04995, partial [Acidobacteria bacterium]|nr:hypothetical protein [Acidobacteriota bacterium]
VWASACLIGMCFGAINPLVFTVAAEAEELGPALLGVSLGTIISLGSIAGLLIPVAVGQFLGVLGQATEQRFQVVWLVTAAWLAGIFFSALALKETGAAARALQGDPGVQP